MTSRTDTGDRPCIALHGAHSSEFSGAAVVHRELAARLPDHLPGTDLIDDFRVDVTFARRLVATRRSAASSIVTTSTPTPLHPLRRIVPIVYDVRWRWTRGPLARAYRSLDLRATLWRAPVVLTISHTVKEQIRALHRVDEDAIRVIDLGPGQLEGHPASPIDDRPPTIVLIGDAPHKRNELAAHLLASIPLVRSEYRVAAISVSRETREILSRAFDQRQLTVLDDITTLDLGNAFDSSTAYLALTTSEGFGFPYIEAAYMGCDVIAPRQAITVELLGEDANYLDSSTPSADDIKRALASWEQGRVQRLQRKARTRSWHTTSRQVAAVVAGIAERA